MPTDDKPSTMKEVMNDRVDIDWWGVLRFVTIWTVKIIVGLALVCIAFVTILMLASFGGMAKVKLTARSVQ